MALATMNVIRLFSNTRFTSQMIVVLYNNYQCHNHVYPNFIRLHYFQSCSILDEYLHQNLIFYLLPLYFQMNTTKNIHHYITYSGEKIEFMMRFHIDGILLSRWLPSVYPHLQGKSNNNCCDIKLYRNYWLHNHFSS